MFTELTHFNRLLYDSIEALAKKKGVSMAQIALAWNMAQPNVSAPIIGSTSIEHLEELAASVHIKLNEEEIKSISDPYQPQAIVRSSFSSGGESQTD